jgi:hypothetical protein
MHKQVTYAGQERTVHLIPDVCAKAQEVSLKEGVSLDEFVNAAVSEKLAHYQHVEWVKSRRTPTPERIAETRRMLRRMGSEPPQPGDELPEGYVWPEL